MTLRRLILLGLGTLGLGAAALVFAFRFAVTTVHDLVLEVLGKDAEIARLDIGWSGVNVYGVRVKAPHGWPTADIFRAERVEVVAGLRGLFTGESRVHSVTIFGPYVSALRNADGKVTVLPGLVARHLENAKPAKEGKVTSASPITIGDIQLHDGVVELFDAKISNPPLKIRLEKVEAEIGALRFPLADVHTRFELAGDVKGVKQDGRAEIKGWTDFVSRDSSITTILHSVDLLALQPYLIRTTETGVRSGTLDLQMQSEVHERRLKAPGTMTLANLELEPRDGFVATFMGVPREAVLRSMEDDHKITVNFTLEGDVDDPKFDLQESFATELTYSLAGALGVSVGGLAEGVGTLGHKAAGAAGDAAKGTGDVLGDIWKKIK